MTNEELIIIDAPIQNNEEDIFNFSSYAQKVDRIIQNNAANPQPFVIGIYGKWGEGKTSFLNLIENNLKDYKGAENGNRTLIYHFNPWRYTSEDEILKDFFKGLIGKIATEKNPTLKKAAKYLSKILSHFESIKTAQSIQSLTIGIDFIKIFKVISDWLTKEQSLEELNKKVNNLLSESNYKIAIFIDDVDRLDKDEIYSLFKLIKLNANFKNVFYILSLDTEQVAKAIHARYGNEIDDGRYFIDKIVNFPLVIPRIEKEDLQLFFEKKFNECALRLKLENKKEELNQILISFNSYNFDSPRHIIKTINSFMISAFAIGEEVNLEDLFGIEYLKVTHENCYQEIKKRQPSSGFGYFEDIIDFNDQSLSEFPSGFKKEIYNRFPKAKLIVQRLFPDNTKDNRIEAGPLIQNLRINTHEHFDKYFAYHTERKISEKQINKFVQTILKNDFIEAKKILIELFNKIPTHKVIFRLDRLIDNETSNNVPRFIALNIETIPDQGQDMFGQNFQSRLIGRIGTRFNLNNTVDELVIEIANNLNLKLLCYFTRNFSDEYSLRSKLFGTIVSKAKSQESVFYETPENPENKMVMHAWHSIQPKDFEDYIKRTLDENNVDLLIRNFPSFWNNEFFGALTSSNYDFMKSIINVDHVFRVLKSKYPERLISDKILNDIRNVKVSDMDRCSIEQNVDQFIKWYTIDNEIKNAQKGITS